MSLLLGGARRRIQPAWKDGFNPRTFFTRGEQGAVYDPSDVNVTWRRNLLTYTEQFDNAAWTKTSGATVTADTALAPNGTTTADTLTAPTTGLTRGVRRSGAGLAANTTFAWSTYAKRSTSDWIALVLYDVGAGTFAWFNVNTGQVGTVQAGLTASIESVGNGWYRCSVVRPVGASVAFNEIDIMLAGADNTQTANAGNAVFIWGAQLEVATTATAYQRIVTPEITYLADVQPQPVLFQDSAGTTPVTAVEQPVGLMLDKRRGLVLGAEVITNGDFSSGTTGWTAGGSNTLTNDAGRGKSVSAVTDGAFFGQTFSAVAGVTYRIQWSGISDGTSKAPAAGIGASLGNGDRMTLTTTGGYAFGAGRTFYYLSTATETVWLWFYSGVSQGIGNYILIDNVSVRELPGNHATQSTSAKRPVLSARVNLLTATERFDDAAWTKAAVTVTANNVIAPDGTLTADTVTDTAITGDHFCENISAGIVYRSGATYNLSLRTKNIDLGYAYLGLSLGVNNYATAEFNIVTGVVNRTAVLGTGWSIASSTIENLGNGWFLCRVSIVVGASAGEDREFFGLSDGVGAFDSRGRPNYTGTLKSVAMWGADVRAANTGVNLPIYQRVNTSTDYDTAGFPLYLRADGIDDAMATGSIDFSTVTSDGQARRNLLSNPTQFDAATWTLANPGTLTANTDIAPDGTTTADTLTDNITANFTAIRQTVTVANDSAQYVGSVYIKKTSGATTFPGVVLLLSGGTGKAASLALNTNTGVGTARTGETPDTIVTADAGTYWRVQWTITNNATGNTSLRVEVLPAVNTDASATWSATTTGSAVAWGAQLELGSTATNFQNIGTDKMTVWAGVRKLSDAARGMVVELSASTATNNGSMRLCAPEDATFEYSMTSRGTIDVSAAIDSAALAAPHTSVACGVANIAGPSVALRLNGTQVAVNTGSQGTGNYGNYALFLFARNQTTNYFNGHFYGAIIRGAASTDAQIQAAEAWINARTRAY